METTRTGPFVLLCATKISLAIYYLYVLRVIPTEVEGMSDKHVRTVSCKGSHSAVTVVCSWVPDDEAKLCMACKLKFTTVRRRVSNQSD